MNQKDVYFRTKEFEGYGKLSHQPIADLRHGARIEVGEKKQDPLDFALWKARKKEKSSGKALGVKVAQAGISSARQWRVNT